MATGTDRSHSDGMEGGRENVKKETVWRGKRSQSWLKTKCSPDTGAVLLFFSASFHLPVLLLEQNKQTFCTSLTQIISNEQTLSCLKSNLNNEIKILLRKASYLFISTRLIDISQLIMSKFAFFFFCIYVFCDAFGTPTCFNRVIKNVFPFKVSLNSQSEWKITKRLFSVTFCLLFVIALRLLYHYYFLSFHPCEPNYLAFSCTSSLRPICLSCSHFFIFKCQTSDGQMKGCAESSVLENELFVVRPLIFCVVLIGRCLRYCLFSLKFKTVRKIQHYKKKTCRLFTISTNALMLLATRKKKTS